MGFYLGAFKRKKIISMLHIPLMTISLIITKKIEILTIFTNRKRNLIRKNIYVKK